MTADILTSVVDERIRQDEKHPKLPKYILHPTGDPKRGQFRLSKVIQQHTNDLLEEQGDHSWYGIMNEEDAEIFSAETIEELETELIQSIALRVRLIEKIKRGEVKI